MSATWFPGITPSRGMPIDIDSSTTHPASAYPAVRPQELTSGAAPG